ncbi:MAG: septation protein A [Myxococcota bacterium]
MTQLTEFIPLIAFFVAYRVWDLYAALAVLMALMPLTLGLQRLRGKSPSHMQLASTGLLLVFGGATLLLRNELFLKWKPTVFNWVLAFALLLSHFVGKQPLLQRLLASDQLQLPEAAWRRLNLVWAGFFTMLGILNLVVAYRFSTDVWVNFKVFGMMALTVLFAMAQAVYIGRVLHSD